MRSVMVRLVFGPIVARLMHPRASWCMPMRSGRRLGNLEMAVERAGTGPHNDVLVFLVPCMINGAMLTYFLTGFRIASLDRGPRRRDHCCASSAASLGARVGRWLGNLVTEPADG